MQRKGRYCIYCWMQSMFLCGLHQHFIVNGIHNLWHFCVTKQPCNDFWYVRMCLQVSRQKITGNDKPPLIKENYSKFPSEGLSSRWRQSGVPINLIILSLLWYLISAYRQFVRFQYLSLEANCWNMIGVWACSHAAVSGRRYCPLSVRTNVKAPNLSCCEISLT